MRRASLVLALAMIGCGDDAPPTTCETPDGPIPICTSTAPTAMFRTITAVDPYAGNPASCIASVPAVVGQKISASQQLPSTWSKASGNLDDVNGECQDASLYSVYLADAGCRWTIAVEMSWPAVCYKP